MVVASNCPGDQAETEKESETCEGSIDVAIAERGGVTTIGARCEQTHLLGAVINKV